MYIDKIGKTLHTVGKNSSFVISWDSLNKDPVGHIVSSWSYKQRDTYSRDVGNPVLISMHAYECSKQASRVAGCPNEIETGTLE